MIVFIDIGGTPANIFEKRKFEIAKYNGISESQLVAILDPFDLSRYERTFKYNGLKIKFPIKSNDVDLDSEKEPVIIPNNLPLQIQEIAKSSNNLRDLMNNLVKFFYPNLKTIKLERILSKNKKIIYQVLKKMKIPVRSICPKCNKFRKIIFGGNEMCCNVKDEELIDLGRYIPQQGFFAVIIYLCGYKTFSNDQEKIEQSKRIMKSLGIAGKPIKTYIKQKEFNKLKEELK